MRKKLIAGVLLVCALSFAALAVLPTPVLTTGATTLETIACNSGVSPCTIGASSTTVLNANSSRVQCLLQNANITDFYCIQGAGTASTSNMHFILKAASAANKGDGGVYSCNQGPALWRGTIVCVGSGSGGTLLASSASSAGY
jgi:hypothetical protein